MKKVLTLLVCLVVCICATSCGKEDYAYGSKKSETYNNTEDVLTETAVLSDRKIIQDISIDVETKEFDVFIENVYKQIDSFKGYTQSMRISGSGKRYAEWVIRIPCSSSANFTDFINENANVTSKYISAKDVTMSYIDTESRISALKSEKEALESLLKTASSVNDIIDIQTRLTEVIRQLESYEAQLRNMDNLIEYSTVTLSVSEVVRTTNAEGEGMWAQIGNNIKNNASFIGEAAQNIFIFVASALPFFGIMLIIALAIIIPILRKKKKNKNN